MHYGQAGESAGAVGYPLPARCFYEASMRKGDNYYLECCSSTNLMGCCLTFSLIPIQLPIFKFSPYTCLYCLYC